MKKIILILVSYCFRFLTAQEPYVVGDLMGQLGNQFFQIAATTSLALDHNAVPVFPSLKSEKAYNVPLNYEKVFYHLKADMPEDNVQYYYIEPKFTYSTIAYRPNMLIRGWFQSDKYFRHHAKEICELFAPPPEIMEYLQQKYAHILQDPNTVAIHFRSYDIEDPNQRVYIKCSMDYYRKAIDEFPTNAHFIVFSNDIEWCKANFSTISREFIFIEGEQHYHDFYLMSLCKHTIISNSSFSWWAAFLNPNPHKKVFAPAEWFNPDYESNTSDLIPEEWTLLSAKK